MRRTILLSAVMLLALAAVSVGQEATTPAPASTPAATPAPTHVFMNPADIKWGPPPPVFAKGASFAVICGNPGGEGPYVVRLKVPKGYKIAPHWHPADENVTVISGKFAVGMGEKFNEATMTELPTGGFALLPAEMRHYAMAKTEAIVQVHGMGPFKLIYVNPADDPSGQQTSAR